MDNLFRDVSRLNLLQQLGIGQERFSVLTYFSDFTHYYFSRFMTNLTSAFKDFSSSELRDFNNRHGGKIATMVKYPALRMDKTIVPIPKGMVNSYRKTLDILLDVMDTIHAKTVERDLNEILSTMGTGKLKTLQIDHLDKKTFEDTKVTIGKLFGKTGLSHSTVPFALPTPADMGYVNTKLLEATGTYYPTVLSLNPVLKKVETRFTQLNFAEADKEALSNLLMTMAYRLSILATVVDHLQGLEHGFVGSMNTILKNNG